MRKDKNEFVGSLLDISIYACVFFKKNLIYTNDVSKKRLEQTKP